MFRSSRGLGVCSLLLLTFALNCDGSDSSAPSIAEGEEGTTAPEPAPDILSLEEGPPPDPEDEEPSAEAIHALVEKRQAAAENRYLSKVQEALDRLALAQATIEEQVGENEDLALEVNEQAELMEAELSGELAMSGTSDTGEIEARLEEEVPEAEPSPALRKKQEKIARNGFIGSPPPPPPGDDASACPAGSNVVAGGGGDDDLWTNVPDSCLVGLGGWDYLFAEDDADNTVLLGGGGDDELVIGWPTEGTLAAGGNGWDFYWGGDKADVAYGQGGKDSLYGEQGGDYLDGGDKFDYITGEAGDDTLLGGGGGDVLLGGEGSDLLKGGDGHDDLHGEGFGCSGNGADVLLGEAGEDWLFGDGGSDYLDGGLDNDLLEGGSGGDTLIGGPGMDYVLGGGGADTVIVRAPCELVAGEVLDGEGGTDTLILPIPLEDVEAMGVFVYNFENIVIEQHACDSECVTPCEEGEECSEGQNPGEIECDDGETPPDLPGELFTFYQDGDGDGFGDPGSSTEAPEAPEGYVSNADDCDDTNAAVFPGAAETCNEIDDNCDGSIDEGVTSTFYADTDGDGFGNSASSTEACDAPSGYVTDSSDCNDSNANAHPGATETCDEVDNDCDGTVDENAQLTFYADTDGDGFGNAAASTLACTQPAGYVVNGDDCNDGSAAAFPGNTESCDRIDNDCDGLIDEAGAQGESTFYADADGDGFGNPGASTQACTQPTGYVTDATDCNDTLAAINPAAVEVCDTVDNDCDGVADEPGSVGEQAFYADGDGDGYGDAIVGVMACSAPAGFVTNNSDCDDAADSVNPAATEVCDNIDNNCNGEADEAGAQGEVTFYRDEDGDGFGTTETTIQACLAPAGYVSDATDCMDLDAATYPGADEICEDTLDNNCDGVVDDGCPEPLPPAPESIAPALDMTAKPTFFDSYSFLFDSQTPVQVDVEPGAVEASRMIVLRGVVLDDQGQGLSHVRVTALDHPELGHTLSREDGRFDFVHNGGDKVTLRFQVEGYPEVQRSEVTGWKEFVRVEDVVMTPFDSEVSTISLAGAIEAQTAHSTPQTDGDGARAVMLVFEPGTSATMRIPQGDGTAVTAPIDDLNVRVTEYTVGDRGRARMPAELPPTSQYTFAAEFSVDEAVAAGADRVSFSQPVRLYMENFLFLPVGAPIPYGTYDRMRAVWEPPNKRRASDRACRR